MIFGYLLPRVLFSWFFVISLINAVILGAWVVYKLKQHIDLYFKTTAVLLLFTIVVLTYIFIQALIALSIFGLVAIVALVIGAIIHMASGSKQKK